MKFKIEKPRFFKTKKQAPKNAKFFDIYNSSLKELFGIRHPSLKNNDKKFEEFLINFKKNTGKYIYFPWSNKLIHSLPEKLFLEVRTARNRNLITTVEQNKYYKTKIGIIGLSIGSNILWPLLVSGGGKFIRIADPDTIELSNLNRLFYPLSAIGERKVVAALKQAYELNPYIKIDAWLNGVKVHEIEKFISKPPGIDILVDELDDLEIKIQLRILAKKFRIPVLMATNLGENVMIDIERFDIEPDKEIFHGLLGSFKNEDFRNLVPHSPKWVDATRKIIDQNLIPSKLKLSLKEVGKTLRGVPQLGITSTISSAIIAFAISNIAVGHKIKSGRYSVDMNLWKK